MAETLDELNRATFFMSVDVVTRYHQKMDKAYLVYPMPVFNIQYLPFGLNTTPFRE